MKRKEFNINSIDEILKKKKIQLLLKRIFDFIISSIGLIVLFPIFLIISIFIKLDSKGPVLFKQVRIGKAGKEFEILKLRTMVVNAEKKGMQITVGKDNRITNIGSFLRKYKIDELPQLINVFKGDMSFVGPRPEVPKYVELYNENQRNILKVRPGITDIASIEFRNENDLLSKSNNPEKTYIEEIMQKKLMLNEEYIYNISIVYDIKIIIKTIILVIF
ncbi:sugar transferase [Clostridium perfringens]|uniref:sugar transferase n=1 Tax=Clostridium perfringens TaxID=1502 RepID=UPI001A195AA0|nr:sugar transferase [Clostridium perfringens]